MLQKLFRFIRTAGVKLGRPEPKSELVVVAGLSGAGKTTFISQLKAGDVPRPITSLLPQKCANWTFSKWKNGAAMREVRDRRLRKLVLHIAINRFSEQAPQSEFLALMREFDRATIVNIATPRQRILHQLKSRSAKKQRLPNLAKLDDCRADSFEAIQFGFRQILESATAAMGRAVSSARWIRSKHRGPPARGWPPPTRRRPDRIRRYRRRRLSHA